MIRFGIAGFGLHAVKRLMPGFDRAKNCRVTALSRRTMAAARQSAAAYKIPLAFDSVAELAASPEVDAVFVTTPNAMHLADVLAAINAGKHVLCEKPMAMNADESRQMVEAARRKNVLLGVAHIFRFDRSVLKFKEIVSTEKIGKPIFARSEFSFMASPDHPRKWLYDAAVAGAGPIFDIGVHCIDTLRFVLGDEVTHVSATAARDEQSGNVESAAALTLEFSRGTIGTVLVSYRAEYRTAMEIVGSTGVVRGDNALNVEFPIEIEFKPNEGQGEKFTTSNQGAYSVQVDAFADAIEGKSPFLVPGEEGWQNQEVLDAALRSIKSGKAEAVPCVGV
jgi:predicted dehydrogenase